MPGIDPSVTFNDLPPDLQQMADMARMRQQMALQMQKQFMTPVQPQQIGPVAAKVSPLAPLMQAVGMYLGGKTAERSSGELADVYKQYQGQIDTERQGLESKTPQEQIAALQASRFAPNRALAETRQKTLESSAQITHLQNQDVATAVHSDVEKGQLDVNRQQQLADAKYKADYIDHLDDALAEAQRHNRQDESAKLIELRNQAITAGAAATTAETGRQMLGPHRAAVGLDPATGAAPDITPRLDDIVNLLRPAPGSSPTGRGGATPLQNAQLDQVMEYARQKGIDFDPMGFWQKQNAIRDYAPDKPGGVAIRAGANVQQHLDMLQSYAQALGNKDVKAVNYLSQLWQRQTGNPLPTNIDALKMIISGELEKGMQVHGGGADERKRFMDPVNSANAYPVLSGAIGTYKGVLKVQNDNRIAQARTQGVPEKFLTIPATEHEPLPGLPFNLDPSAIDAELSRRGGK